MHARDRRPARSLTSKLFVRKNQRPPIRESELLLMGARALVPQLEEIIDLSPGDGSGFAAMHLLDDAFAGEYVAVSYGETPNDALFRNKDIFTKPSTFDERLEQKGYPRALSSNERNRARDALRYRICTFAHRGRAAITSKELHESIYARHEYAVMISRITDGSAPISDQVERLIDRAGNARTQALILGVPSGRLDELPSGYTTLRWLEEDERASVAYRTEPSHKHRVFEELLAKVYPIR